MKIWVPKCLQGANLMDLRFISRDGDRLIFEAPDGTRHSALLEEDLKSAIKSDAAGRQVDISPREIQTRLRHGETVEELARELGVNAASLEPFAAPVLDELRFLLDSALSTPITDGNHMSELGQILERDHSGCSRRIYRQDDQWILEVVGDSTMHWKYDSKNRHLEPLDNSATNLTLLHSKRDLVTATLPPVSEPAPTYTQERYEQKEEHTASVLDLVEELRARRAIQEQPTVRPAPAKGRTSLPSWDEIVLGTTSESDSDQRDS
jgi:hypothetical protein